ncbi:tRNA epoxyqueuosine(34) reductase QueG [Desulfosporosinus sp. BG]|uniref:tRNA epoxyqueuosine(34) reductase QueG n=1 Tax=Desulfosporosinus sp. BG TaxID=1633135 RepID=UPI00083B57EB|nr:tRNA epoxyqueuosine(34) reductase QueG [Desulfosporosinus sp. BG]ODA42384.1 Epoxyqueuosine (oQ) reductase QueG [Desulfosporosinus sp. BG]
MDSDEQLHWKINIKKWGCELGFVAIGFTSAEPVDGLDQLLQARIDRGLATPFEGKEVKQRIDPKAGWQDCQTITALAYPLPYTLPPQEGEGVIARSAVGEDYHRVLRQTLNRLVDIMRTNGWPGNLRWQVDTGPLVERAFAVRAGIGWIGRNQQLIIPGYGSFVVLALLLLDREIASDRSISDQCGVCQSCVEVCPAHIIGKEPFASKDCVSYLTQSKETLSPEECKRLGTGIFGCDSCQDVCPHNQKRLKEEQTDLSPFSHRRGVDLLETLNLSKREFQERFQVTAAGWRGKAVLQRNAYLAMQNVQDCRLKPWLSEHKKDKSIPPIISSYL